MPRSIHPLGVRARWWWHHHPVLARAAVVSASLAAVFALTSDRAAREPAAHPVAVATRELAVGHRIAAGDIVIRAVVVDGGHALDEPVGRVVTAAVLAGEPIVRERVAPEGVDGAAALVPAGWRAVAVPVGIAAPPVAVGDRVDLLVTAAPGVGDPGAFGELAAPDVVPAALVVAAGDEALTVAVERADAERLAAGIAAGVVTVALVGAEP